VTALSTDDFLKRFFSPPNRLWPIMDPDSPVAATMVPFLAALPRPGECPLILPCRRTDPAEPTTVYVVCWDTAHAGRIRALLEAAVAHHWCRFDGRVARLDSADPVDAAVLDLVGPGTTFRLRPTAQTAAPTLTALRRLVATIGDVPLRVPKAPRPIGRMLREFDLALASGAVESSASLLREIETNGGVSHENVAFLQVRRLARLGKDQELLAHGSLPTLVYVDPPRLVREGVLAAWARVNLARPMRADDVDAALGAIREANPDVAMLVDDIVARTGDPDVSTVCALVAIARQDAALAATLASNPTVDPNVLERLTSASHSTPVDEAQAPDTSITEGPTEPDTSAAPTSAALDSWLDWVGRLGTAEALPLETGQALAWLPAWRVDPDLADAIDALPEFATDDLLAGVAALLDADDLDHPAPHTAAALVRRYLVAERFSPYDLGAIAALLGIFLRSGPSPDSYREVLSDVRGFAHQWVSVGTATRAIDLADVVACGPAGDSATRADFVAALLAPLNQQKRRLPASLRQLAGLITEDVALDYDWAVAEADSAALPTSRHASSHRILLYSLDNGTLARVEKTINLEWPHVRVEISSDKDGNPALKQHARNADLIVVATRRATHAATGFITDNAGGALIRYPDGAGSASMLRAVESGIVELLG
jgi:hypothetical protein